ncbi:NAD(P)/FAD-dependent oxidoreductase [Nocardia sp. NBC_01730]|uniref:flavin-containing monooxygenase n=1 Tax=Nocardia sp. NBC_01730 TaxID=2975998 RepID=UPI002E1595B6|nr:NAD(P)/FAD-dependent oxidoreductase [Nocardia sp. NBC_01730]
MSAAAERRDRPARATVAGVDSSDLQVAVVGAGFGGIGMGAALRRVGITRFAIYEKADDVGGVWRDNTYPDCHCDVPSHVYSFSFAPYRDRRIRYPGQREILDYLRRVVNDHALAPHLRLATAVSAAAYLEDQGRWELITATGQRVLADVVVFAVGQLHRPNTLDLPGRSDFAGAVFHTADWDHNQDLIGREVAVIGTGSSAAQILPTLAATARRVRVFQRTPHWVLPKPSTDFGPVTQTVLRVPGGHRLYRRVLTVAADAVLAPIMRRGWSARPAEWIARHHLRHQIPDPALRAVLTPDYPIGGKRIIFDSDYYPALNRTNVELVTAALTGFSRDGLVTADGTHHRADVVIYATGFRAPEFLVPVTVRGRGGILLHEQWRHGATALLGMAVPNFPNAFLIAGPNSFNPAGSNPAMKEHQIEAIIKILRWRDEIVAPAIEVKPSAMESYRVWLERAIATTVWPGAVASWYKHPSGAVTNPWPASRRRFARMTRQLPARAFEPVRATSATSATPSPEAQRWSA